MRPGGRLVTGFVVLHVLCCGLPVLIAAGTFAGFGALLGSGLFIGVGVAVLTGAVALAVPRLRRSSDPQCCAPSRTPQGEAQSVPR
jgi:hypothetical protein